MADLKKLREAADLSQFSLVRRVGISRMRVQVAESGHVTLQDSEIEAVNLTVRVAIEQKS